MHFIKTCIWMVAAGSILLVLHSCSEKEVAPPQATTVPVKKPFPDLSLAIQKRVEKKPEEAIALLREYNQDFPNSSKILIQLSRALVESGNYSLAAFRLEQTLSLSTSTDLIGECAEAHRLAGDLNSAKKRFIEYLKLSPENLEAWLSLARILEQQGNEREALNAFEQAREITNPEDCIKIGNLYLKKKILVQAEKWFKEAAKKESNPTAEPLLGLLRVKIANADEDSAEALVLAIEKAYPKKLASLDVAKNLKNILVKRRISELNNRSIIIQNSTVSDLAQALLQKPKEIDEPVVSTGPKLSPLLSNPSPESQAGIITETAYTPDLDTKTSLAEAFGSDQIEVIEPEPIELGWSAYLARNYSTALLHAREAINLNSKDAEAWRLSSQAHFQLGKTREAEMTILEAIRHNPNDLTTRIDYLNIARETLPADRYLRELEKTHELFPNSGEILWQLARRYHLVERMPVTAGILYRRLLKTVPEGSGLHNQAKMELIKIQNL